MSKILVVVLDGLSDGTPADGKLKTALQCAQRKPLIDQLATDGSTGSIYPVSKDFVPETDTGMLSLFGYDVKALNVKRAPIEWYGLTGDFPSQSMALRVNFATLRPDNTVDRDTPKTIDAQEAKSLIDSLNVALQKTNGMLRRCELRDTTTYQAAALLLIRGDSAFQPSDKVSNTDPWYPLDSNVSIPRTTVFYCPAIRSQSLDKNEISQQTADLLNEFVDFSHNVFAEHKINAMREGQGKQPANYLILRHPGNSLPELTAMRRLYDRTFAYFHDLNLERGIALLSGIQPIRIRSAQPHSLSLDILAVDYKGLAEDILQAMSRFDVIYTHLKGPDKAAHLGDRDLKAKIVEHIDEHFLGNLIPQLDFSQTTICVTADHATPWYLKLHSDDRVPILVRGPHVKPDNVREFNEFSCQAGGLGLERGSGVLPYLLANS